MSRQSRTRPQDAVADAQAITTTIGDVQQRYAIQFSPEELRLLTTSDGLLFSLDQQRKFLLRQELRSLQCPACLGETCRLASDTGEEDGDRFTCNRCGARLYWHLGFVEGWEWFSLLPGQTITVPETPPDPRPGHRKAEQGEEVSSEPQVTGTDDDGPREEAG